MEYFSFTFQSNSYSYLFIRFFLCYHFNAQNYVIFDFCFQIIYPPVRKGCALFVLCSPHIAEQPALSQVFHFLVWFIFQVPTFLAIIIFINWDKKKSTKKERKRANMHRLHRLDPMFVQFSCNVLSLWLLSLLFFYSSSLWHLNFWTL